MSYDGQIYDLTPYQMRMLCMLAGGRHLCRVVERTHWRGQEFTKRRWRMSSISHGGRPIQMGTLWRPTTIMYLMEQGYLEKGTDFTMLTDLGLVAVRLRGGPLV